MARRLQIITSFPLSGTSREGGGGGAIYSWRNPGCDGGALNMLNLV